MIIELGVGWKYFVGGIGIGAGDERGAAGGGRGDGSDVWGEFWWLLSVQDGLVSRDFVLLGSFKGIC